LIVLALVYTHSYLSLVALLAAALHELGHIAAAKLCSIQLKELKLGIFGAALSTTSRLCSYKKEIILCVAGPAVNLILGAALLPFFESSVPLIRFFTLSSLFLGFLNILPIHDLDGGRILKCILSQKLDPTTADKICKTLSFCLVSTMWLTSVYLIIRVSSSLSLFVFSAALFCKIFIRENT
jgi:stage IV sporulation protein FB